MLKTSTKIRNYSNLSKLAIMIYKVWYWNNCGINTYLYRGKSESKARRIRLEYSTKVSPIFSNF